MQHKCDMERRPRPCLRSPLEEFSKGLRQLSEATAGLREAGKGLRQLSDATAGLREAGKGLRQLSDAIAGLREPGKGLRQLFEVTATLREAGKGLEFGWWLADSLDQLYEFHPSFLFNHQSDEVLVDDGRPTEPGAAAATPPSVTVPALVLRGEVDAAYKNRVEAFSAKQGRYPSRSEDLLWGKDQKPEIGTERIKQLRHGCLPKKVLKGGRNTNLFKPVE